MDQQNHSGANFQNYTVFSLWDTYRAEQPLISLLHPERMNDMVQSLITNIRKWPAYDSNLAVMGQ